MLRIKKISKSFGGKVILDNCNFSIKKGQISSLIGPNGCGKTTLFNIISGLIKEDSGMVYLGNTPLSSIASNLITKRGIVRTFQDPELFKNLSVYEHLLLSIKDNSNFFENIFSKNKFNSSVLGKMDNVLKDLKLFHKKDFLSKNLSGGQRKLLDLAMVLVKDFELILLDEPTAGVTPELRKLFVKIILKLKQEGKTIFLIEHDMNFVTKVSDEVIVLHNGRIFARGKANEIKKNKEVLEIYLGK